MEQAKLMVVYAILLAILLALNTSPANKCQHKFQPEYVDAILETFYKERKNILSYTK